MMDNVYSIFYSSCGQYTYLLTLTRWREVTGENHRDTRRINAYENLQFSKHRLLNLNSTKEYIGRRDSNSPIGP